MRLPQLASARTGAQAGFTLMELLVAITLLSLLSLVLTSSLRFSLTAWARGADHADRTDQSLLVQDFLRRAIADAYPYFLSTDPTRGGHVDFAGRADSLQILTLAPRAQGAVGRMRLELLVERTPARTDLVAASVPELAAGATERSRKILIPNVEDVTLSYFGRKRSDKEATWHAVWSGEPALPQLVRIKVALPSGDTRAWPELVIAPRIAADVSCVYDPLTKLCRGR